MVPSVRVMLMGACLSLWTAVEHTYFEGSQAGLVSCTVCGDTLGQGYTKKMGTHPTVCFGSQGGRGGGGGGQNPRKKH